MNPKKLLSFLIVPVAFALSAESCDETRGPQKELIETLKGYSNTWRWGEIEQTVPYLDPEWVEKHPINRFELERFHQYRIGGYEEQTEQRIDKDHVRQLVSIDLINIHTQQVRTVIDKQEWRYDEKAKRWWLTSGLPDLGK